MKINRITDLYGLQMRIFRLPNGFDLYKMHKAKNPQFNMNCQRVKKTVLWTVFSDDRSSYAARTPQQEKQKVPLHEQRYFEE